MLVASSSYQPEQVLHQQCEWDDHQRRLSSGPTRKQQLRKVSLSLSLSLSLCLSVSLSLFLSDSLRASVRARVCSRRNTTQPSWTDWTEVYGNDKGSTLSALPSDEELLGWARAKLDM